MLRPHRPWLTVCLLLLSVALLLPATAAAKEFDGYPVYGWDDRTITVIDSSAEPALVRAQVRDLNRLLPKGGPRLSYEVAGEAAGCNLFPQNGEIAIGTDLEFGNYTAYTQAPDGTILWAVVCLGGGGDRQMVVCHEMMHALTAVPDYPGILQSPKKSCVHGLESAPGAWDKTLLAHLYGERDADKPGRKKRGHHR